MFPKSNFSPFSSTPKKEYTKEECLTILGESIELTELQTLANSAKKNGPDSFKQKIKKLLSNGLIKMQL